MDADGEVNGSLFRELPCTGADDRETVIQQFQQVLGVYQPSLEVCTFFLDMSGWNLQSALGAYYDYGVTNPLGPDCPKHITHLPEMQFEQDVTGESILPSTHFVKTWRVRNSGVERWPPGCYISCMEGKQLSSIGRLYVQELAPGEESNVRIEMISPAEKGIYQCRWQLNTSDGIPFGESIWCIIIVDDVGVLGITQQLARAPLEGSAPNEQNVSNPFGSCTSGYKRQVAKPLQNEAMDDSDAIVTDPHPGRNESASMLWSPMHISQQGQRCEAASEPTNAGETDETPDASPSTYYAPPE